MAAKKQATPAKGKTRDTDADDLIGDTGKRAKNVLAGKSSGAGNAKGAGGAKGQGRAGPGAAGTAARRKVQGTSVGERATARRQQEAAAERAAVGEGKYYFPSDDPERAKIQKALEKSIKPGGEPISTKQFASDNDFETWKVRLVAKQMARENALKVHRSGDSGGVLLMQSVKRK